MKLERSVRTELSKALLEAFPRVKKIEKVLFNLGTNLDMIASWVDDIETVINITIETFESYDKIPELLEAASRANPHNLSLQKFISLFALNASFMTDEQIHAVTPPKTYINPVEWRGNLESLERQVCSIEIPLQNDPGHSTSGTGLLIEPDLILTNYHVVECLFDPETRAEANQNWAKPEDVIVRFDYILIPGQRKLRDGVKCGLAKDDWCKDYSKPSKVDQYDVKPKPPSLDELDYAVLRLDREIGSEPAANFPDAPLRGYYRLSRLTYQPGIGQPVILLHFPQNGFLRMSFGSGYDLVDINENGTRIKYKASTNNGSSGAPCFDIHWTLIGIHRGNLAGRNGEIKEGIPINAIFDRMNKPPPGDESPIIVEPPPEKPGKVIEILDKIRANHPDLKMFMVLHENVVGQVSQEGMETLEKWLAQIRPFLTAPRSTPYLWQLLCLDQYIRLTGVSGMPESFQSAFSARYSAGKCDAPIFFRLAAEQVKELVDSISSKSEILIRASDLSGFVDTIERTISDISELEKELAGIKDRLQMFDCLRSEDGQTLPQDEIDRSLRDLRTRLDESFYIIASGNVPINVRGEINTHIWLLNKQSPQYRNWLTELAAKIESSNIHNLYLN